MNLAAYTLSGTATGLATSLVGAAVLHRASLGDADVLVDARSGAIGGGISSAVVGLGFALTPPHSLRQAGLEAVHMMPVAAMLGGAVGSLVVAGTDAGRAGHVDVLHEAAAGWLGAVMLFVASGLGWWALLCAQVACCCCPSVQSGLGALRERLVHRPGPRLEELDEGDARV